MSPAPTPDDVPVASAEPFDHGLPDGGSLPAPIGLSARLPVDRPLHAFVAVAASVPEDFGDGVVVLLLGIDSLPVVAVAVDGAPEHDLTAVCDLIGRVRLLPESEGVHACVLAVHRAATGPEESAIAVGPDALQAWAEASRTLRSASVDLLDVLVVEPTRWMSAWENAGFGERY